MTAEEYLKKWKENQPFGEVSETFGGGIIVDGKVLCKFAEDYHHVKVKAVMDLLKIAKCHHSNCDNNGTIAYQTNSGDWEPEPCQWCHEKEQLLKENK